MKANNSCASFLPDWKEISYFFCAYLFCIVEKCYICNTMTQKKTQNEVIEVRRNIESDYDEKHITLVHGDYDVRVEICLSKDGYEDELQGVNIEFRCKNAKDFEDDTIVYFRNIGGKNKVAICNLNLGQTAWRTEREWLHMERLVAMFNNLKNFLKS